MTRQVINVLRGLAAAFAVTWVLFGTADFAASQPAFRPNVVILFADDLGYSDVGCYGGEIATPNLDALARNGLRYTQIYNTARCWPSRGALLTGYYAQQIRRDTVPGVVSGGRGRPAVVARLLPEMLKPLGYRSYQSGKWHVDGSCQAGGFDRSYTLEDHNRFFAPANHFEDDNKLPPIPPGTDYYVTTGITDHALRCLKDHAANHADRPFFAHVAYTAPHFPLQAPAADIARQGDRYAVGWDRIREARFRRQQALGLFPAATELSALERQVGPPYAFPDAIERLGPGEVNRPISWNELTDVQKAFQAAKMAVHAAMVDRMDREIGRILDQLRAMNALDNTLILFLSDNGASAEIMVRGDGHDPSAPPGSAASYLCLGPGWSSAANTPFRRHKTWVHEGGIATPLIAHWPKGIAAKGELRTTPSHVIDIVPTILEIAGGKPFSSWDGKPVPPAPGKSLVPTFANDIPINREYLWWLHEGNRAIRVGDYKLVAAGTDAPWELYDLAADRDESTDLASKMPEKVQELERLWNRVFEEHRALATADLP